VEQMEKPTSVENVFDKRFQLRDLRRGNRITHDRPPWHEAAALCSERTDARLQPIRDDQGLLVSEERGDLLLVGLELVVSGSPFTTRNTSGLIGWWLSTTMNRLIGSQSLFSGSSKSKNQACAPATEPSCLRSLAVAPSTSIR